jgi:uncharacterized protein (DUF58 family)
VSRGRSGFTTRASCLLAAGLTAVACGLLLGAVDLVRAGVLAAAVPLVAALSVHRSRVRIANRRSVEPVRASAGEAVTIHLTITNRSSLRTGVLMLEDRLPERLIGRARFVLDPLGSHETRTVSYRMPNLGRGRYRAGPLQIRLSDPFRMIDLTRSFTATSEFVVAPVVDPLPVVEPPRSDDLGDNAGSHSIGMYGADDQSTREYRMGDDLRKIHWRSSARTGLLMVRQEERPWQGQNTVLLDLRASAHATGEVPAGYDRPDPRMISSLEWAVSAADSIGSHVMLSGRHLSLISDPTAADRMRFSEPTRFLTQLALARDTHHADLTPLAGLVRSAARDSALVAILGRVEPASLRLLADAHPRGRSTPALAMLMDVDTWADPDAAPADHSTLSPVEATAAVLRNAGWRVRIVRHGETTAQAWQVLLAGFASSGRATTVLR